MVLIILGFCSIVFFFQRIGTLCQFCCIKWISIVFSNKQRNAEVDI